MSANTTKIEENTTTQIKTPALFELGLKELVKAKSDLLLKLRQNELDLISEKHDFAESERIVLLTTDFKELGLTNEKMRNAYINEKLDDLKKKMDFKKHMISNLKDDIEIVNDLIRVNELLIKGE